ncbi:DUF4209 domain-containing protein [Cytobacillus firmus]
MGKAELENLTTDELITLSENTTDDFQYDRSRIYSIVFEKFKRQGNDFKQEEMRKEILAFELSKDRTRKQRFREKYAGTTEQGEEWKYPDIDKDFSVEIIEYYKTRTNETCNPILKARYSDIVWEFLKDFQFAKIAALSYLNCSDLYFEQEWDVDLQDSLCRALEIGLKVNNQELVITSISYFEKHIKGLSNNKRYRYIIEISEVLTENYNKLKEIFDYNSMELILLEAIEFYKANVTDSFNLQRSFLEIVVELKKKQKNHEDALTTRIKIAEIYEDEAEWKAVHYNSGHSVAATFYQHALNMYLDIGTMPEKAEELKLKIAANNKLASESEYSTIGVPIEIPKKAIDDYLEVFKSASSLQFFQIISIDQNLVPSWESALNHSEDQAKELLFQNLFATRVQRGNIVVKDIVEPEEKLLYNATQHFQLHYRFVTSMLLSEMFSLLKKLHGDYKKEMLQFIKRTGIISESRFDIIKVGIDRYFAEDYISSSHILLFQIEGILRDVVGKLGLPTFSYRNKEMRERMLSDLLDTLASFKGFDQDFLKMISIFLNDITADNLRNDFAHGIANINVMNKENTELLLFVILKISSYEIKKEEPNI